MNKSQQHVFRWTPPNATQNECDEKGNHGYYNIIRRPKDESADDDREEILSAYRKKYGHQPQTMKQLISFLKQSKSYKKLSYGEAREIMAYLKSKNTKSFTSISKSNKSTSPTMPLGVFAHLHLRYAPYKVPPIATSFAHDISENKNNGSKPQKFVAWSTENKMSVQERRMIADTHYDITQSVIKSIKEEAKNNTDHSLLPSLTNIEGADRMDEKELHGDNYWENINNGQFELRLDFDYDEWMNDKQNYQTKFIHEIAEILKVEPEAITIENYRRGSTKFKMYIGKIWTFYKSMTRVEQDEVESEYIRNMRVQDQIQVKRQDEWYDATITEAFDDGNGDGKIFQVRYNPKDNTGGKDPFFTNTEWFHTNKEAKRLRFPGQFYNITDMRGGNISIQWRPPPLASRNDVHAVHVNDHVFVEFNKNWRRCIVVKIHLKHKGWTMKLKELKTGKIRNLNLWETGNQNKIKFEDMRKL